MGNDYPTAGACGFAGRTCALDSYPDCDRSSMSGVTAIPDDSSADSAAWVDGWVGEVADIGGICRLPGNRWAMYFAPRDRAGMEPVQEPKGTPPKAASEIAPSSAEDVDDAGPASDAGAEGAGAPIASTEDEPEDFIDGLLRSAQDFVDDLIPKRRQDDVALYGSIGAAALVLVVSASLLIRSIRRGRARAKAEGPVVEVNKRYLDVAKTEDGIRVTAKRGVEDAKAEKKEKKKEKKKSEKKAKAEQAPPPKFRSPNLEVAERLQLMFAVHERLAGMKWYDSLTVDMKFLAMRSYSAEGAMLVGVRSDRPLPVTLKQEMVEGEYATVIEQDGERVTIRKSELADVKKAETLALLYDSILHEVETIKGMGSQVVDMNRVDPHVLTRALLMAMQMNIKQGTWDEVVKAHRPGGSGLEGPIPPDWIIDGARRGWGMEGRGDPFSPLARTGRRRRVAPYGVDKPEAADLGKTLGHSTFWAQLITSRWYVELDTAARSAIEQSQRFIEDCLHQAYDDPLFRERLVDGTQFTEEGFKIVISEVLDARGLDVFRDERFAPLMRRDREKRERVEDSWLKKFRGLVKRAGK